MTMVLPLAVRCSACGRPLADINGRLICINAYCPGGHA